MSAAKVDTLGIGFIGTRSIPFGCSHKYYSEPYYLARTDDDAVRRHILACNLQPTSRRRAKINTTSSSFEERVFLVELNELEC